MNRADIRELSLHQGSPAVSLFVVCNNHRGSLSKINDLLGRAIRDVVEQFSDSGGEEVCHALQTLQSRVCIENGSRSVAIFVNHRIAWVYQLSYQLTDAIWVSSSFVTWPICYYLQRTVRYWVVIIFKGVAHLFEGYDDCVIEVVHRHTLYNGEEQVQLEDDAGKICGPYSAVWGPRCRYSSMEVFMRKVNQGLQHFMEIDPLPIVCFGDPQSLRDVRTYCIYKDQIIAYKECDGLLDRYMLYQKTWPSIRTWHDTQQAHMIQVVRHAAEAEMIIAADVEKIWHALHAGMVRLLCIEKGLQHAACYWDTANSITDAESCKGLEQIDAIEALVEVATQRTIPIYWYEDGELTPYMRIVAVMSEAR